MFSEGALPHLEGYSAPLQSSIARIETKFLLPLETRSEVLQSFGEKLQNSYPEATTHYTWIRSVYFDSANFDLFQAHFLSPGQRFKMRTRRYAPNGRWLTGRQVIEVKQKREDLSVKSRLFVDDTEAERLREGKGLGSASGFQLIDRAVTSLGLTPACEITYLRHAFDDSNGLRVTVDEDLTWTFLRKLEDHPANRAKIPDQVVDSAKQLLERYRGKTNLIVEIKHQGSIPDWLNQFLDGLGANRVSFSKYCFVVSSELFGPSTPGEP